LTLTKQNLVCPSCESKNYCIIFWGYPADIEWYLEAVAKKEIAPGGCVLREKDPKWHCNNCQWRWGNRDDANE